MADLKKYSDELLSIREVGLKAGFSPAFIEYAISSGCPTIEGRLSHRMLVEWLIEFALDDLREFRGLEASRRDRAH